MIDYDFKSVWDRTEFFDLSMIKMIKTEMLFVFYGDQWNETKESKRDVLYVI